MPDTGGANIPAINDLLMPFNMAFRSVSSCCNSMLLSMHGDFIVCFCLVGSFFPNHNQKLNVDI